MSEPMQAKCEDCGTVLESCFEYDGKDLCFDCYAAAGARDVTEAAQCMHKPPRTQLGEPCPKASCLAEAEQRIAQLEKAAVDNDRWLSLELAKVSDLQEQIVEIYEVRERMIKNIKGQMVEHQDAYGKRIAELVHERDDLRAKLKEAERERDEAREQVQAIDAGAHMWVVAHDDMKERAEKAELERDNVRAMHARILSWPPVDVERARTTLLRVAAQLARDGSGDGVRARDAIDSLAQYSAQCHDEEDTLRAKLAAAEKRIKVNEYIESCVKSGKVNAPSSKPTTRDHPGGAVKMMPQHR